MFFILSKICFDPRQNTWRSGSDQDDRNSSTYLNDNYSSIQSSGGFTQNQYSLNHSNQLSDSNHRSILNGSNNANITSSSSSGYSLLPNDSLSIDYTVAAAAAFNLKNTLLNSPIGYHQHQHFATSNNNQSALNSQPNTNSNELNNSFNYALVPSVTSSNLVNNQSLGAGALLVSPNCLLNHASTSSFHHPNIHHQNSIQSDHSRRNTHHHHHHHNQMMHATNQHYHLSNCNFDLHDNNHYRTSTNTTQNESVHMNEGLNFEHYYRAYVK